MKYFLLLLCSVPIILLANSPLREKYPHGLLTDDHGVLSKADLIFDIKRGNPRPYDINEMQAGYNRWQCFPVKDVKFSYSTWKDSYEISNEIITLCDFRYLVKSKTLTHHYYDRRARPVEFCREMFKDWKRLIKGEEFVCISGEPDSLEGKEKGWTWSKVKTRNGCISLFIGDCETGKYKLKSARPF